MDADDFAEVYQVTKEFLEKYKACDDDGAYYVTLVSENEDKFIVTHNHFAPPYPYTLDHLCILKDLGLIYFEITKPYFTEIHIDIPLRWIKIEELGD